jgi:hypothetical protein
VNKPIQEIKPGAGEPKDVTIYKVQVLPSTSQIKAGEMVLNGTTYKISGYTYLGAARYTIGEFNTLAQASSLQRICKQEGNSGAFVAAFKNGTRSEVVKKEEIKITETPITAKKLPEKETVNKTEPAVSSSVNKPIPEPKQAAAGQNDGIIYRVQVLPGTGQIKAGEMVLKGTTYKLFVYTYLGVVRYTIGEFNTTAQATALQRICRQEGNSGAFVVAFKNGNRSLDPNLYK